MLSRDPWSLAQAYAIACPRADMKGGKSLALRDLREEIVDLVGEREFIRLVKEALVAKRPEEREPK